MSDNNRSLAEAENARLKVLLVETRSPWESGDVADFLALARAFLESGEIVRLHLIQNGVIWLLGPAAGLLKEFHAPPSKTRLILSIDDLSLDLRGISRASAEAAGVVWSIDELVAEVARPGVKTIWHS